MQALVPYLTCIRNTLDAALCLRQFPSQRVEGHNKAEVEAGYVECLCFVESILTCLLCSNVAEILLNPIIISRSDKEKILIEGAANSVRISIKIKQLDDLDAVLADRFSRFLMPGSISMQVVRGGLYM